MKPMTLLRQAKKAGLSKPHRRVMMENLNYKTLEDFPESEPVEFPSWAWRMLSWDLPGVIGDYIEVEKTL